jgi:peptidoglycan/xylan/chitin deacetylase (PgdA/CDA1 family)
MGTASTILQVLHRAGVFRAAHALWPPRLTVLNYHRIADRDQPGFDTYKPNVSASPTAFAEQMDFVKTYFDVIGVDDLTGWLCGEGSLPARPLLITFDDGYADNYTHARPILQERGLPAAIYVTTGCIGSDQPFYWDLAAYCFAHTEQQEADLPLTGLRKWANADSRQVVLDEWIERAKLLPDSEKQAATARLPDALGVAAPVDAFAGLHMTWGQMCEMIGAGIAMGAHTVSHPILTRIPLQEARAEILESRARIEAETGQPVTTFAYTNGQLSDFNQDLQKVLRDAGFDAAFTLLPGPTRLSTVRKHPFAIRRVYVGYRDTLPRLAAKVVGAPRLISRIG